MYMAGTLNDDFQQTLQKARRRQDLVTKTPAATKVHSGVT